MNTLYIYSFLAALCFSLWPIIARFLALPAVWTGVLINAGTLIVTLAMLYFNPVAIPKMGTVTAAILAGMINGLGFLAYSYLLSGVYEASTVVIVITVMSPIIVVVLGALILGEPIMLKKVLGILVACVSIYLLTSK
jgi:uncharacterized membrane protein